MNEFELFQSALDIDDLAARKLFLNSACEQNAEMLNRVESLLASHEGESRFLQSPVVEQIGDDPTGQAAATLVMGTGSTHDESPSGEAASILEFSQLQERVKMADEIPLGYLEPSTKPDSLGRLAHYEILEVVGSGAFGTVLRAFDDKLQRVVAIKVMAPELASTSPARKRFIREAQASAAIRHENVVSVYAVEEKPIPYLVMEFIPGMNLQQRLDERGPLDVVTVLRMGTQIAEGLAAAHAKDLIHRDIKPGNILLESGMRDRVKITDFGLARAADDASMTQSGTIAGTPMYMAPEQALGHKLDQRADLFSFGSVLYQMVSGRPPFRASSTLAVLKRLTEETPRPIQEIIPETPQWLCDIIAKLHAKNPDERYQSAREIADVLANCEAQLKEHSRLKDLSMIPRAKTQPAGWWKWVAAAALVLPLLAVGWYAFTRPASQPKVADNGSSETSTPHPIEPVAKQTPVSVAKQQPLPLTFKNILGMEFVIVPKGKSWLGGGKDKLGDKQVEIPADFYLGKYEVTQEEWTQVMGENPSHFSRTGVGMDAVKDISDADLKRFPVEMVSWDQCQDFIKKLNGKEKEKETGWVYRLPTEAEWEYACRGGPMADRADSAFDFYFAKPTNTLLPEQANLLNGLNRMCKVGSYEPNRLGLFDMYGNAYEWCDDKMLGDNGASRRVLRGGGWHTDPGFCRTADREPHEPSLGNITVGLRLARVPSGASSPEVKTPPLAADVLKDAVLLMDFEKDTFYEKDGKTYVRDLSGNGNDGLCEDVEFTPDGNAGGGLACKGGQLKLAKSLISRQPNYTIAAWCRYDKPAPSGTRLYMTSGPEEHNEICFTNGIPPERNLHVNAWNADQPGNWKGANTDAGTVPMGWFFVAVSLTGGETGKGQLRIVIDDKPYPLTSQLVTGGSSHVDLIGYKMDGAIIDELAVFQRALTDEEIAAVRALGLKGTPLNVGKSPPVATQGPLPPTFKNTIGMEFVIVPKGKSWLGGGKDKPGDKEVEIPADFYLGKYEITQEEWEKVMGENPSHFSRAGGGMDAVKDISDAELKRFPVENVSWDQCQIFVVKLNELEKETGWVYRLPTEVEWEYACRGGPMADKADSAFDFYFAKPTNTVLPDQANFEHGNGLKRTCRVDSYEPNVLGLYDMHGNVWQWCDDNEKASDGTSRRVGRGGGWAHAWGNCRAAYRFADPPSSQQNLVGLRLARVPSGAPSPEAKTPPTAVAPFTDADVKRIAALPAAEQVEEVRKALKRLNPGFDGTLTPTIENGVVTELRFHTDEVVNIAPVRALKGLTSLDCSGSGHGKGKLSDLSPLKGVPLTTLWAGFSEVRDLMPLKGMPLTSLHLRQCRQVQDLSPLKGMKLTELSVDGTGVLDLELFKGMPLTSLDLGTTQVRDLNPVKNMPLTWLNLGDCRHVLDLEPVKGMPLTYLNINGTQVRDLEQLKGMPLKSLQIHNTVVTDLSPLKGMQLEDIRLTPKNITLGLDILRDMKSLRSLGIHWRTDSYWPAPEFWERYDKGEFAD